MKLLTGVLFSLVLVSCGGTKLAERKPVPPKGSDESSIPWNDPSQGPRPGGPMADMMEGR
ncbi:MAG: hypothetical protein PVJ98_04350 [Akkermansiaceae bacterium]|jgi:hypothetical protein